VATWQEQVRDVLGDARMMCPACGGEVRPRGPFSVFMGYLARSSGWYCTGRPLDLFGGCGWEGTGQTVEVRLSLRDYERMIETIERLSRGEDEEGAA
jgi:hypothetical protein